MNKTWMGFIAATFCLTAISAQAVTINLSAGVVRDENGDPMADGGLMILQSAGPNGTFGNVTDTTFSDDADDISIAAAPYAGTFVMDSATTFNPPNSGIHLQAIQFNLGDAGLAAGQKLRLLWFPGLGLSATNPGPGQPYGVYTDAVGIDGSSPWVVPASNSATVDFNFSTIANGGSVAESAAEASNQTAGSSNNPPSAVCQAVTVAAGGTCQAAVSANDVDNGSSDSDGTIETKSINPTGPFTVGATVVTLTVTDNEGATATCTASVTVQDLDVPVLVCPDDVAATVAEPQNATTVNFTAPTATDNCPNPSVVCVPASGSSFGLGSTTVTCTATDASELSASCTFAVTVTQVPNSQPTAICQNVVTAANGSCQANVTATQVDNGSSDSDGTIASRVLNPAGPYALGDTAVTLTVTDNVGATATCSATITVEDQTAPVLSACPSNISQTVPNGQLTTVVEFTAPTATDNCSTATVVCEPVSGSNFSLGTTTVTCTATDEVDNSSTCSFTVTLSELIGECRSIKELITIVDELELGNKAKNRLTNSLRQAKDAKRDGNLGEVRRQLRAFISELRNLRDDEKIDAEIAEDIITCARIQIELTRLDDAAPVQAPEASDDNGDESPATVTF